jgi:L-iditol 2-dehydrogenase
MKAAVLTGIRGMDVVEMADPQICAPTGVKIRMAVVGVCGSDIHYYTTGRIGSQVVQFPYAVGHEGAGVVVEVGEDVTRVKPGDRIAVDPAVSCHACDQCLSGRSHTCRSLKFLGCPGQLPGCLTEYLVMPEASCYPLPEGMSFTRAALSEPLAIGVYAVSLAGDLQGKKIGILGSGPIGLCVLAAAREAGVAAAYMTDKIDARLDAACRAGAAWAGNPVTQDVERAIADIEPLGLDVVFECCGQQEALDQGVRMLRPGGKLMIVGIPEVDRISFSIDLLRRKEICIQNVRRQEGCVQRTLDGLASGSLNVDALVTHRFPLERAGEAFDLVAAYGDGVIKAMIDILPEER